MRRIPEETIRQIKEMSDIVDVVGQYVDLKKSGSNYLGLCPFHSEKTPSFTVSRQKQFFHCFGCGAGGDVYTFLMKREGLTYPEAIRRLAEQRGIVIAGSEEEAERAKRKESLYGLNQLAMQYYFQTLMTETKPKAYLEKREIGYKVINRFFLGYARDSWDGLRDFLTAHSASVEDAIEIGLLQRSDKGRVYDRFRNRLMFPITDYRNRVIGFGGRTLGDDRAKYINSSESFVFHKGDHLYGLQNVSRDARKEPIILVEGYMDALQLYQRGFHRVVASLGTALTPNQAKLLKRYGGRVYLLYDGDEAGVRATERAAEVLAEQGMEARIIPLPEGVDPDDYVREKGPEALQQAMDNALNRTAHFLRRAMQKHDLNDTDGRIRFIDEAAAILAKIDRAYERDEHIRALAKRLDIREESLRREVESRFDKGAQIGYKNRETTEALMPEEREKPAATRARTQLWILLLAHAMEGTAQREALADFLTDRFISDTNFYRIAEWIKEEAAVVPVDALRDAFAHDRTMDRYVESVVRAYSWKGAKKDPQELYRALRIANLQDERDILKQEVALLAEETAEERVALLVEKLRRLEEVNRKLTQANQGG